MSNTKFTRHFSMRPSVHIAQHQNGSLPGTQLLDGSAQTGSQLDHLSCLFRAGGVIDRLVVNRIIKLLGVVTGGASTHRPCRVDGDSMEPSPQGSIAAESGHGPPCPDKGFLRHISGKVGSYEANRKRVHRVSIPPHQLAEGIRVSLSRLGDELLLVGLDPAGGHGVTNAPAVTRR
jgi:hypothetical protein